MSTFECMNRNELVNYINSKIVNNPNAFPKNWNLRAKIVYRNNEERITLTHSQNVNTKQAWLRFDLMMPIDIMSQVS